MHTTLDKSGRVLIPSKVRERLGLAAGTPLIVDQQDGEVRVRAARRGSVLVRKGGVLVFAGTAIADLGDALQRHRAARVRVVGRGQRK